MEKILKYETLTPMFLTGADNKTPEFRIPSLKGVMHYWWRAVQHADNLDVMRNLEGQLFGSSDTEIGGSKFRLIADVLRQNNDKEAMLPHKFGSARAKSSCFKGSFSIKIVSRNPQICRQAVAVAELSAILGGLGKRSRRGFGSYYLVPDQVEDQKEKSDISDIDKFANKISNLLSAIAPGTVQYDKESNGPTDIACWKFHTSKSFEELPFNYPSILEIFVKRTTQTLEDILKFIGHTSHLHAHHKACGSASPRQASPICFSFYKYNDINYIVTTLLSSSINSDRSNDIKMQKNFRDEVLHDA